jgi:hypothetical protein
MAANGISYMLRYGSATRMKWDAPYSGECVLEVSPEKHDIYLAILGRHFRFFSSFFAIYSIYDQLTAIVIIRS